MPRISDAVKLDHALIKDAYHRLSTVPPEDRDPAHANEFTWALDRYLMLEQLLLTPALESHRAKIHHARARQRRLSDDIESMRQKLVHMQKFAPAEPSFTSSLRAIWVDLEPHVREEDGFPGQDIAPTAGMANDLDRLEEALSEAESNELGANYERIRELL